MIVIMMMMMIIITTTTSAQLNSPEKSYQCVYPYSKLVLWNKANKVATGDMRAC